MMDQEFCTRMERRRADLVQERSSFISHWQDLEKFLAPRTSRFFNSDQSSSKGNKKNENIINPTGTIALRTLKSGMMAGVTSPARPWFRLITSDSNLMESDPVKEWLYEVEQMMRVVFTRSNFYNTVPIIYNSTGCYGTGAMMIVEDEESVIRCHTFPVGTFCIAVDDRGRVDTFLREFKMTVKQLVLQFGIEHVSDQVKQSYDNKTYEREVDVVHLIDRNIDRKCDCMDAKNKPYMSCYWEVGKHSEKMLRMSGFDEFPVVAPRWDIYGEDVYGYSPGMDCLADIKQLQKMEREKLEAIAKKVRPSMLADASLRTQRTSMLPGDVTYIDNLASQTNAGYRPAYQVNFDVRELGEEIKNVEHRIREVFFSDMMLMFAQGDNSQMTAREVEERHSEKLLVLGPVMERLNEELLDPVIERTFAIMLRRGLIPPPPEELQNTELKIEYTSIFAQAQKLVGVANLQQTIAFVGNMAQLFGPSVLDKIDADHTIDEFANMQGVSPKVVVSDDEVKKIRGAKAAALQQEKQMAAMPEVASAMNQGAQAAKTLSETSIDNTSALTRFMGAA